MEWYFLLGPFRGGIFFGVRSEVVFSLGSVPRVYLNTDKETFKMALHTGQLRVSKFCESEMATKDTYLVL
jgi:hypothetical protein